MSKYADLHLHSLDQFDSQNNPDAVCARMKELGAKGFALTQHGVLSGIEPMRLKAKEYGLKFVPGIETYYGADEDLASNRHLILLSKDAVGYKAISMAVSDSQNKNGFAVMHDDTLKKYFGPNGLGHGHVVATSACINGPLAAIIRRNEQVDAQIERLKNRFKNVSDCRARIEGAKSTLEEIEQKLTEAKTKRDAARKLSERKYTHRINQVEKLKETDADSYNKERAKLDEEIAASNAAKETFEQLKQEVSNLLRRQSITKKELKALEEQQARFEAFESAKADLDAKRLSDDDERDALKTEIGKFRRLFGPGNFYIEVQYHGIPLETAIYPKLAALAKEMEVPLVATNDVHIVSNAPDERLQRQILRSMRFGTAWEEEHEGDAELYIKTDEEMAEWLLKILPEDAVHEAIANIRTVFDACDVVFDAEEHYPRFPVPNGQTSDDVFDAEIEKGIKWRFPDGMDKEHEERLKHEVSVIKKMGYVDYHLIVQDFLSYGRALAAYPEAELAQAPMDTEAAKKRAEQNRWDGGISVGPGRGSAVGSLVCYLLGITSMDPLKYELLFERFLNPERVSMPDIDCDLAKKVRPYVIRYVQNKYGEDAVCGISTMNAQAPRGAIRIAAKYYALKKTGDGVAYKTLGDKMAKQVPKEPGISFSSVVSEETGTTLYQSLCAAYHDNKTALEILRWAKIVEGCFTAFGAHAAGIVISDNVQVKEYVPLRWNEDLGEFMTQCDMQFVEEKGLLKMDFLGLRTLDIMTSCIKLIEKRTGSPIDPMLIPLDDDGVYKKIFQQGNTNSVFQFESDGMKNMLKRFQPTSFEDLIILVSMFRPGPLQFIDGVIDVKHGRKPITYLTDKLRPILERTYGGIVYQEQVMQIFQQLAGYTLGGADQVRRYMSKKKMDKLVKEKEAFIHGDPNRSIPGCTANGVSEEAASALFEQMTEFARYAFNKSHGAAYALLAYWTGWLKLHYPAEFLCSAMNWAQNTDKIQGLMREAAHFGVDVLGPDINQSETVFAVKDGKIIFGLSSVKGVGKAGEAVIEERDMYGQFVSYRDVLERTGLKRNAAESLIASGALDAFCPNRKAMLAELDVYKTLLKKLADKQGFVEDAEKLAPRIGECVTEDGLNAVQAELGIALLSEPTTLKKLEIRIANAKKAISETQEALSLITLNTRLPEDHLGRLKEERDVLGAYVTGHPLDGYDLAGYTSIEEATDGTAKIAGMISSISIKARKTDGKPMAFFTLEDKTGRVEAAVFSDEYERCAPYISEDKAVELVGKLNEEESVMTDENGDPVIVKKFIVRRINALQAFRRVTLPISSYPIWHLTKEAQFRKQYEQKGGIGLMLYDQTLGQLREATWRVSEEVLSLPGAF